MSTLSTLNRGHTGSPSGHGGSQDGQGSRGVVENVVEKRDGVFQVDLEALLGGEPAVVKIRDGVYAIDLHT